MTLHLKLSLHLKFNILMRADDYLINTRFFSYHRHLKSRGYLPPVAQVEL